MKGNGWMVQKSGETWDDEGEDEEEEEVKVERNTEEEAKGDRPGQETEIKRVRHHQEEHACWPHDAFSGAIYSAAVALYSRVALSLNACICVCNM